MSSCFLAASCLKVRSADRAFLQGRNRRRIDHDLITFGEAIEDLLQDVGRVPNLNGSTFQTISALDVADVLTVFEFHCPGRDREHVLAVTANMVTSVVMSGRSPGGMFLSLIRPTK